MIPLSSSFFVSLFAENIPATNAPCVSYNNSNSKTESWSTIS